MKLKSLLTEIAPLYQKHEHPVVQAINQKMEDTPWLNDPIQGKNVLKVNLQGLVVYYKKLVIAALRKDKQSYHQVMNIILKGREKMGLLFLHWVEQMEKNRNENLHQNLEQFITSLDEAHTLTLHIVENIVDYENFINAKKDIGRLNEMLGGMSKQIDELFGEWSPEGDYPVDIRTKRIEQ
jgi:hypothetical protein